jgi:hypothetical protein
MVHWIYPANVKYYDVMGAFRESETYWPLNSKVSAGDVIYMYLAAPYQQIAFACKALDVGLEESCVVENIRPFFKEKMRDPSVSKLFMKLHTTATLQMDGDSPLSYHYLKQNGLTGMLMGPRKLENNPTLLAYIKDNIS